MGSTGRQTNGREMTTLFCNLRDNIADGHCVVFTDRSDHYQKFDLLEDGGRSFNRFGQVSDTRRFTFEQLLVIKFPHSFPWQ